MRSVSGAARRPLERNLAYLPLPQNNCLRVNRCPTARGGATLSSQADGLRQDPSRSRVTDLLTDFPRKNRESK